MSQTRGEVPACTKAKRRRSVNALVGGRTHWLELVGYQNLQQTHGRHVHSTAKVEPGPQGSRPSRASHNGMVPARVRIA